MFSIGELSRTFEQRSNVYERLRRSLAGYRKVATAKGCRKAAIYWRHWPTTNCAAGNIKNREYRHWSVENERQERPHSSYPINRKLCGLHERQLSGTELVRFCKGRMAGLGRLYRGSWSSYVKMLRPV